VYLSLTGTSAEDADSGQVGRGNRANGLIAFARPTGGEATAGKNALAHAGKVYSVLSHHLARRIHAATAGLAEVYVHLAARIGDPVDQPWIDVQVVLEDGATLDDVEPGIRAAVEAEAAGFAAFRARLGRGEFPVC
jgi:S-adenosylmethionine synthetase